MGLHNPKGFLAMFDRLVPLALEGESPTQADQLASMTAAGMNGILRRMKLACKSPPRLRFLAY